MAIYWSIQKIRIYLEGYHFVAITDHQTLKWLNSIESPSKWIARLLVGILTGHCLAATHAVKLRKCDESEAIAIP